MKLFSFKKNNPIASLNILSELNTDMHSHLLPGIDDGSPNMETSIHLINSLQQLGYKKLITTPHIYWDTYKNTTDIILKKCDEVNEVLLKKNSSIELKAAAEYYLDEHFKSLLQKKDLLTLKDDWLLIEFSFAALPMDFYEMIFEIQMKGYTPVMAHPERYNFFNHNKEALDKLFDTGCIFQLNILSLAGYYGKAPLELANYLLKKNYVSLLGTDLHHERHCQALQNFSASNQLITLLQSPNLLNKSL